MDRDAQNLTTLLLDPFLTTGEAAQEAEALATVRHPREDRFPRRPKQPRVASERADWPATAAEAAC